MKVQIEESWRAQLKEEFSALYFEQLIEFVREEYAQNKCHPKGSEIFSAFNHCSFENTTIVIIGQDPYHGDNQANGLCFSVKDGTKHPPSLINIFKELAQDLDQPYPESGNLERWAAQGVLLLNATLTVRHSEAGSHQGKGWELFTDAVISKISAEKEGVIFLLWGGFAKKKAKFIDAKKHTILESGHPSPLSANRGYWFGNGHFSSVNKILSKKGNKRILW